MTKRQPDLLQHILAEITIERAASLGFLVVEDDGRAVLTGGVGLLPPDELVARLEALNDAILALLPACTPGAFMLAQFNGSEAVH